MHYFSQVDLFQLGLAPGAETIRIPVLPEGTFEHPSYGTLDRTPALFGRMIQNFTEKATGYQPMLNADHATFNPYAAAAPAYGWFESLEYDAGQGLFATVSLTDLGKEAIQNRRYRYISAETWEEYTNSTGATFENVVSGAALTNVPFQDTMPGLFGRQFTQPRLFSQRDGAQFWVAGGQSLPLPDAAALAAFARRFSMDGVLNFDEVREVLGEALKLETALRRASSPGYVYCYVLEVYPDWFIYEEYSDLSGDRFYRRGYTLDGGTAALGADITEVEQVWVTRAREAMTTARKAAQQAEGAEGPSSRPAGPPATGGGMSTLMEWAKRKLGLNDTATEAEAVAALEAAPAPAPAEAPPAGEAGAENLSRGAEAPDVQALQRQMQELDGRLKSAETARKGAEDALRAREVEELLRRYQAAGKLTPAMLEGEPGTKLRAFAQADPAGFTAIYDAAPALIDLTQRGLRSQDDGGSADTFAGLIQQIQKREGCEYAAAMAAAERERPDLYRAYRANQRGGAN
jgi:hypothetical protein